MSYNLAFQLVFYSRDGVMTSTDSIDANPDFGNCDEPAQSIEDALREVRALRKGSPYLTRCNIYPMVCPNHHKIVRIEQYCKC